MFWTPKTKRLSMQLSHFEKERKNICQKESKLFLCYRSPDHCMAKQLILVKKSPKWENRVLVWKMIQIFQVHFHMTSAGIWQRFWLIHMCKKEVWMDWHAVENKDVSRNSAFIRLTSTDNREKIHRNWTKEKISITHGQLPHKDRKGRCPEIKLTVLIIWNQYLLATFNASFPCLLSMKFYFIFHIYCA